jgi:hypothetical protein
LSDSTISKIKLKLPEANETTPSFKDIYIKNIVCLCALRALCFNGLPEVNTKNIDVENVIIKSECGVELCESDGYAL